MAGPITKSQAEGCWNKYNKDGNDELTVEEVKEALKAEYEGDVDDFDVKVCKICFIISCLQYNVASFSSEYQTQ